MEDRERQLALLKEHLLKAQNRTKLHADKKRQEITFQVGDSVLLKLQPYAQSSLVNRPFPKLALKYFGPYKILEKIGAVTYRLELPDHTRIDPIFHVSQLKSSVADHTPVYSDLLRQVQLDAANVVPEQILDRRLVQKGGIAIPQVLIKWRTLPASSATWEDYYVVKQTFPTALAWGKQVIVRGEMSRLHRREGVFMWRIRSVLARERESRVWWALRGRVWPGE